MEIWLDMMPEMNVAINQFANIRFNNIFDVSISGLSGTVVLNRRLGTVVASSFSAVYRLTIFRHGLFLPSC